MAGRIRTVSLSWRFEHRKLGIYWSMLLTLSFEMGFPDIGSIFAAFALAPSETVISNFTSPDKDNLVAIATLLQNDLSAIGEHALLTSATCDSSAFRSQALNCGFASETRAHHSVKHRSWQLECTFVLLHREGVWSC